jgi:hydroxyacylglutathione hydrolase
MLIETKAVPPFYKNGYLIHFESYADAIIIDPGDEVDELLAIANEKNLTITHILLTHAHIDHLFGVAKAKQQTGAKIYLHPDDLKLYANVNMQCEWFGVSIDPLPEVDEYLSDGQIIKIAEQEIKVIHTPGHSPGGVSFLIDQNLFCGDILFEGSVGRTDLPGGDFNKMISSIKTKLLVLDDATVVYSGHGPETTIGDEKRYNPFIT